MKLLIISGTPKKDGLCASLVQAAKEAGGEKCGLVSLSDLKLEGCRACGDGWGSCLNSHICVIGDGFNELKTSLAEYEGYVFITPVYWGEVSEPMKQFLDRLRRCEAVRREESVLRNKKCLLVASAGGSGGGILTCLDELQRAVSAMGAGVFDYIGVNRWNSGYKREALACAVRSMAGM
jgi:multimeric flavodoxin WrbA